MRGPIVVTQSRWVWWLLVPLALLGCVYVVKFNGWAELFAAMIFGAALHMAVAIDAQDRR